jgi:lysine 2,3-aminomutase
VGDPHAQFSSAAYERQLAYIAATPQIRDVLLSGGDPLMMSQRVLKSLLKRLRAIPHLEIIRIGTRVPVFLPQRVTDDLVAMLRQYHPLWMNIHFNHPKEITSEVETALARLADAGIPLGSQTVLLAGINDCPNVMMALVHKLVKNRVRPYYIYQCDLVHGAGHFRTPVSKGIEIMESLRGHTSGFAVPTYVIDAPEGGGKVPILPNYLISMSDSKVIVRNYEGFIATYAQPTDFKSHNPATCSFCRARRSGMGQEGVAGLLANHARTIAPEGWHGLHQRDAVAQMLSIEMDTWPGDNGRNQLLVTSNASQGENDVVRPTLELGHSFSSTRSGRQKMETGLRVGLIYNLKHNIEASPNAPADALAEYDSAETIQALEGALRAGGHEVIRLEADASDCTRYLL